MNISKSYEDSPLPQSSSAFDSSPLNYYNIPKSDGLSGNSLKDRVLSLKDTGSRLVNDGRINEGLDCYITMFNVLITLSDPNGSEFNQTFDECLEELNKIAMKYVQHNDTETGHKILSFCDEATQPGKYGHFPLQRTQTMNNIGCLYRRVGKLKGALNYLRSALMILNKNNLMQHAAVTYLNLSAIQSQMGDHQQAFQNAKNALVYAQEEILLYQDKYEEDREKYKEKVVMLAIVYHNMGSEEEHLQNLKNALDWYEKAYLVMEEYGIVDEKLYHKFKNLFLTAQEKFGNLDMHMNKRSASPMSATPLGGPRRFFGSASVAASPRDGPLNLSINKRTIPPNVDLHHRNGPQNQPLKSFLFKDKRIVSQPRLDKQPIVHSNLSSTPSHAGQPRTWEAMKTSSSLKSINPRPLYRERMPAYKRNSEGESPAFEVRKKLEKAPSKDTISSKNQTINDIGEDNVDSDDSQAYYKVKVNVKKKEKPIEKSPVKEVVVPVKPVVKPEDEIKALEDIGVLNWSDSNIDTEKKKEEKQAIKKNQHKFFSRLKDASVTTITGQFKLMNNSSSSESSSQSPKNTSKESKSKKKSKKAKKVKKQREEQAQQVPQSPEKDQSKEEEPIVEEEIVKDVAEQISEEVIEEVENSETNRSKSKQVNQSQSFSKLPEGEKSSIHKSEVKVFRESKLGISPLQKQRSQAGESNRVGRPSKLDKSSKHEIMLSSMQWNDMSMHSKAPEPEEEEEPSPRVVLTRAQMLEKHMKQFQATVFIQQAYRRRIKNERAKLMMMSKKKQGNKVLIKKKWLILKASKTVKNTVVELEESDYSLNVFALPDFESLLFVLTNGTNRLRYDAEVSYAELELLKDQTVTSPFNMSALNKFCEDLIPRMYVIDHLLLFKEKVIEKKQTEEKNQDDSVSFSEQSEMATQASPLDYKQHEDKIIKIQSRFRGNIARQQAHVLKQRNFKFLYREVIKVEDQLVRFRVIQYNATKKVFLTAVHLLSKRQFNKLEVPEKFMEGLGRKEDDVLNRVDFDMQEFEMSLLPSVESQLYPEKKQNTQRRYEIKDVLIIQKCIRKFLAKKMFAMRLKKARENPSVRLVKKFVTVTNGHIFTLRIHYYTEQKHLTIRAKSLEYHADIPIVTVPIEDVDRNEFSENLANIKRLVDVLIPYIRVDFTKNETYVIVFDRREYDKSTRRFESKLLNFVGFDANENEENNVDKSDVQKRVWKFLQDKGFIETNQHIIKNFLGLQSVVDSFKIIEENHPDIKNFGGVEDSAASKIQRCYRKVLLRRYFNSLASKDKISGNRQSASQILTNSVRGKSYSLFSEAYQRMMVSEDELRRQSTNDYFFVKTVSGIQFANTKLEAKAHVFYNKINPKEKTIDVEIVMPLIGLHDYLKIAESDIFQNSIKPASFLKKIEEHLISKLQFNDKQRKVVFSKDGGQSSEAEMIERAKATITPFIQAKMTRLKFLRRKALTKGMLPVGVRTTQIDNMFINMSFYWHPSQKQLRALVEQIANLAQHKEIIVKFDSLQNNKELKKLIENDKLESEEFLDKIKPYLDYISKHILIQPETKSNGGKKDFKIMMDGSVFKVEFVNSRFVLVSLRDITEESLKEITLNSAQVNAKYAIRASKLLDIKQLEGLFPNKKVDLKDLLQGEGNDKEGHVQGDILAVKKEKEIEKPLKAGTTNKVKAALIIQKAHRGNVGREEYEMLKSKKMAEAMKKQSFGVRVKKVAKKIDDDYWTITVYRKTLEEDASMFYFFASNLPDSGKLPKPQAKGVFRADNMLFLNCGGKDLADFFLDRIEINGQSVEFNMTRDNFVKLGTSTTDEEDGNKVFTREIHLPTEAFNVEMRDQHREEKVKGTEDQLLESEQASPTSAHNHSQRETDQASPTAPDLNKRMTENDYSPLESARRYLEQKKKKNLEEITKKLPENLLDQKTEANSNNLLLYNVFYNNDDTTLKPAENALLASQKSDNRRRTRKDSIQLSTDNVVKISIDMNELRKYNPTLVPKAPGDLKQIAAELTSSIQVNERGEILINDSKLNPNALNVLEKRLNVVENPIKDLDKDSKINNKKKILFKVTKVYGDKKYLLLINYLERPSNLNNILSIVRKEDDQVYEEFELFIEVNVVCLSNNAIRPLTWELSLQEGQQLSGLDSASEVAKFFAANIHLFGDQILLSTPFQSSTNFKNVMIMNENAIKMIQNRFRSKKFAKNFTKFRNNLIVLKTKIIARAVIAINTVSYHMLGYESRDQDLEIEAWSLMNYEKHTLIVSKKLVERLYAKDKKLAFNSIFKFMKFELNKKKEQVLMLKEQSMFDYLRKQGEI